MSKHEGKTDIQAKPWEVRPPDREPFYWETEAAALEEESEKALKTDSGPKVQRPRDQHDPSGWLTVDEVFDYMRMCQKHPEIWDHMMPLDEDDDEEAERASDEEIARRYWIEEFRDWYRMKFHPTAHYLSFYKAEYLMEGLLLGEISDLYGAEVRAELLTASTIVEKR